MKWLNLILFLVFLHPVWGQEVSHDTDIHHKLVENKGQWPDWVQYRTDVPGGTMWIEKERILYHFVDRNQEMRNHAHPSEKKVPSHPSLETCMSVDFIGSNAMATIATEKPSNNYFNFFIGRDSSKWANNVVGYSTVTKEEYYEHIDLKLIREKQSLKYEFHVHPGGNPDQIQMRFLGINGLKVTRNGSLEIKTGLGSVFEQKPYVYQIINGKIIEVKSKFKVRHNRVTFELADYDPSVDLIIDPIIVFATYNGATSDNFGMTATYGYDGTAYTGGMVYGNNYPRPDPAALDSSAIVGTNSNSGITDVFLSKYNQDGTQMLWSAFLGGGNNSNGTETVHSLICDSNNNVYMFGVTSSPDFPVLGNAFQTNFLGGNSVFFSSNGTNFSFGTDIYVAKISSNGHDLLGSTLIGGSDNDGIIYNEATGSYDSLVHNYGDQFRGEIMLGPQREVIVATSTRSNDFPTLTPIQAALNGLQDGAIFSLSNDLSTLNFSTYFGGSNKDACYSVKVDSSFNLVIGGGTSSDDLQVTTGVYQTTYGGGKADGFILKLPLAGNSIMASSYLGFGEYDQVYFVSIDRTDKIFVYGQGTAGQIPVVNAGFSVPGSPNFIMKFNDDLTVLLNSMSFGKANSTVRLSPTAFLVDRCGEIYISGWGSNLLNGTPLNGYPISSDAFRSTPSAFTDFYMMVIDRHFDQLIYGTYIGDLNSGDHVDGGTSRFDQEGIVYQSICGGCGNSDTWPTTPGAWSSSNNSTNCNNVVYKFDFEIKSVSNFDVSDTIICAQSTITFTNTSSASDEYYWDFGDGQISTEFEPSIFYSDTGTFVVMLIVRDSVCLYSDTSEVIVNVGPEIGLITQNVIAVCDESDTTLIATTNGSQVDWLWSSSNTYQDTLNNFPTDSTIYVPVVNGATYFVLVDNGFCNQKDSVVLYRKIEGLSVDSIPGMCDNTSQQVSANNTQPQFPFTYQWSPASAIVGSNSGNSITIQPDSSQFIYVTMTDSDGCVYRDSAFVIVKNFDSLTISATAVPDLIPSGGTSQLNVATNGTQINWSPELLVTNAQISNPKTQKLLNDQEFLVIVSDGFCSKSTTVEVNTYDFACDGRLVYVPNAFSPNGDGENDILFVRTLVTEELLLRVFNRWGEMVFETTDKNVGWDGTFKGKLLDPDVYDYYMKAICIDGGEYEHKGNITLLR